MEATRNVTLKNGADAAAPVVDYTIYRDLNTFPIDTRKPCHSCTQRQRDGCHTCRLGDRKVGFQGRPYRESEPGGCLCGKKNQRIHHPNANIYWPTVLAGVKEEYFPDKANHADNLGHCGLSGLYDHLGSFKLIDYHRRDNGYCGPGRDRYGCLGQSRMLGSPVFGVVPRSPGDPQPR
jgi:hypothetical protein